MNISSRAALALTLITLLTLTGCTGQQQSTNQKQETKPAAPTNTNQPSADAKWKIYHEKGNKYTISIPAEFTGKENKFGMPVIEFPETYTKDTNLKSAYIIVRLLYLEKEACIASHLDDKQPITAQAKIGDRTWYADNWEDFGTDAVKRTEALSVRENGHCYRIELVREFENMDKYRDASGALSKTAPKQYNDRKILDAFIEIIKTFTTNP